jgi:uncharacterized cupin superfamily protein
MPQIALIVGHVTYTPGDGAPIPIPVGEVEVTPAEDSTTLSWTADNGAVGAASIPNDAFELGLREGRIHLLK